MINEKRTYLQRIVCARRTPEPLDSKLNKTILTHPLPPDNHLQPAQTRHIPEIIPPPVHLLFSSLQPPLLPLGGVLEAETPVAAPGEDGIGVRGPGAHGGEDEGGGVAVEEVVEGLADGVEGYEGGEGQV